MSIKLIPFGDRVLAKRRQTEEKTKGGIIIPDTSRLHTEIIDIISVSESISDNGIKAGDICCAGRYSGIEIEIEREPFLILRLDDIIGVIREDDN